MGLYDLFSRPALDLSAPPKNLPVERCEFLAVDFETTGVDPTKHEIVSMGWVPVSGASIDLSQANYHLIKGVDVGESATIHLITNEDLEGGIGLEQGLDLLLQALKERVLLAHFAGLEVGFLNAACKRLKGSKAKVTAVDTFAIERRHMERMGTYPRGEDLRLARVRERYGLPAYGNHNAFSDALACAELFLAQQAHNPAGKLGELARLTQV